MNNMKDWSSFLLWQDSEMREGVGSSFRKELQALKGSSTPELYGKKVYNLFETYVVNLREKKDFGMHMESIESILSCVSSPYDGYTAESAMIQYMRENLLPESYKIRGIFFHACQARRYILSCTDKVAIAA